MYKILGVLIILILPFKSSANTIILNFDTDLSGNNLISGQLLNDAYSGIGVTFNDTAVVRGPGNSVTSSPNFASGSLVNFKTDLVVFFDGYATAIGASNVGNSAWTLTAYDKDNNILGQVNAPLYPNSVLLSGVGNIKKAVFSLNPVKEGYGIDDLVFNIQPVPAPPSILLFASGLLLIFRRQMQSVFF